MGSSLGLMVTLLVHDITVYDLKLSVLLLPPAGALVGALVGYQLSRAEAGRSTERFALNGQQLALILGGATLGTAGGIRAIPWVAEWFNNPTLFLLPPAGTLLGGLAGYGLSILIGEPSSYRAASEGTPVRILPGVAPLPGGGMLSVMGLF